MYRNMYVILPLMLFLLAMGCSSIAYKSRLQMRIGMEKSHVIKLIDEEKYMRYINDSVSDMYDVSDKTADGSGKIEVLITSSRSIQSREYYLFAFIDGKLLYWGYPYEFKRSEKSVLRAIGKAATDIIYKQYEY